jgi:hypothetical protein
MEAVGSPIPLDCHHLQLDPCAAFKPGNLYRGPRRGSMGKASHVYRVEFCGVVETRDCRRSRR